MTSHVQNVTLEVELPRSTSWGHQLGRAAIFINFGVVTSVKSATKKSDDLLRMITLVAAAVGQAFASLLLAPVSLILSGLSCVCIAIGAGRPVYLQLKEVTSTATIPYRLSAGKVDDFFKAIPKPSHLPPFLLKHDLDSLAQKWIKDPSKRQNRPFGHIREIVQEKATVPFSDPSIMQEEFG